MGTFTKTFTNAGVTQLAIYIASAIMGTSALKNGFNAHTDVLHALKINFWTFLLLAFMAL